MTPLPPLQCPLVCDAAGACTASCLPWGSSQGAPTRLTPVMLVFSDHRERWSRGTRYSSSWQTSGSHPHRRCHAPGSAASLTHDQMHLGYQFMPCTANPRWKCAILIKGSCLQVSGIQLTNAIGQTPDLQHLPVVGALTHCAGGPAGLCSRSHIIHHYGRPKSIVCAHAVMSSEAQLDLVREAFAVGAADFLVKPIRRNEVVTLWQHVWRSMQALAGAGTFTAAPLSCVRVDSVSITIACWGVPHQNASQVEQGVHQAALASNKALGFLPRVHQLWPSKSR